MYKIKIPKILFLALDIAYYYRRNFYNTNDLTLLANEYKKDLVRQRADKKDYRYLDDTNFGGLRGNFSTLVTWKGFIKRGSQIVNICSIGRDRRLVNAVCRGDIILNKKDLSAHTNNDKLKILLELESWLLTVRENQAHIKTFLKKNKNIKLERENNIFKKVSVVKSPNDQYFIRALLNNFVDSKNQILEFTLYNLWEGTKLKKKNLHLIIVIPSKTNSWNKIFAIKNEDLFIHKPFFLRININTLHCVDENGEEYQLFTLNEAFDSFSSGDKNIEERLKHNWKQLKKREQVHEVDFNKIKQDEFSEFLENFLNWKQEFEIDDKKVVNVKVSSSGGPDVILTFSGGTKQTLELEHKWKSYLDHGHHRDNAWSNSWLYSNEKWDKEKIIKLFKSPKEKHNNRIPDVFLALDEGVRKAFKVNWENETFEELKIKF